MNKWKKRLWQIFLPHPLIAVPIVMLATAGLVYSFSFVNSLPAIQYGSYATAAYAVVIVCFRLPKIVRWADHIQRDNRYIARLKRDMALRVTIALCANVGVNGSYMLLNILMGMVNHSVWFYSLAGYYFLLTVIRIFLLKDVRSSTETPIKNQWIRYRFTGILLIIMNLTLTGIVFYIVAQNRGHTYHSIQAIAMAAYTFTITTMAIVNVIRYGRSQQPLISAVRFVNFAAVLVSMLSLENAMLNTFGNAGEETFRQTMTAVTGCGICLFILSMGIYMVAKSTKQIREQIY